jgi:tetratricopeptide (TPR) repeat protein
MVESNEVRLGLGVRPALGALSVILCTAVSGPALAQTGPQIERETREPGRTTESTVRGTESQRESLGPVSTFAGRDVTFEEVLRDPDNADLNYAFALTQIRQGDLLGALSTLERILLKNPNVPRVRLLYAIVLYRLNAVAEAEREMDNVLKLQMDDGLRRELEYYRGQIAREKQSTKFTAIVRFGWNYDSNRNAAPLTRGIVSSGAIVPLPGEAETHSLETLARLEVEHDLGFQRRHRLVGSVTGLYDASLRSDQFTLGAVDVRGGIALDLAPQELIIQPHYRWAHLEDNTVLQAEGGSIRFNWPTRKNLLFFVYGSGEYQVFNGTDRAPSSRFRTGAEWRGGAGVRWTIVPEHRLTLSAAGIRKEAREDFFDYSGAQVNVEHGWLLGRGMFLLTNLSWEGDWYDGSDPNINSTKREDNILRVRTVFGVPFATLTGWNTAPRPLRDVGISVGYEYTRAFSNIDNYRYQNHRVMAALTKRFDF